MKLHTGDTVIVISGKDKGKTGSVIRVLPTEQRVVIAGINMRTRHVKKTYQEAGRILKYEASIHASKVMIVDPKTKKGTRVGYKIDAKGLKTRVAKRSGEEVKKVSVKKAAPAAKKETPKTEKADKKEKKADAAVETTPAKKQPFWQRMKFGSNAMENVGAPDESRMKQDHTIAQQNIPPKSAGRGS